MKENSTTVRNRRLVLDGFTRFAAGDHDVEHWDVEQPVAEPAPVPHGMF
ncbi:hypothetical protein [Catellatospora sp. NPDC049133]